MNRTATTNLDPIPPWQSVASVVQTGPQTQIAMSNDGVTTLLAWPGDVASPNLNVIDVGRETTPTRLQLGVSPRQVRLYPAPNGRWQILWLDRTLSGEDHLMGALVAHLNGDYQLERGPLEISTQSTGSYSAGVTTAGDLMVAWAETSNGQTSLMLRRIDSLGRPRQPIMVNNAGVFPTIATDAKGNLHLAWLEASAKSLWTIRYTPISNGDSQILQGIPVGVIQVGEGQTLESFALGIAGTNVYCLWGVITVAGESSGRVAGLSFPLADSTAAHSFAISGSGLEHTSLRWPVIPAQPGQVLLVGLTGSLPGSNGSAQNFPVVVALTSEGMKSIWPVIAPQPALISRTNMILDLDGRSKIVWSSLRRDGTSLLYYATGHAN